MCPFVHSLAVCPPCLRRVWPSQRPAIYKQRTHAARVRYAADAQYIRLSLTTPQKDCLGRGYLLLLVCSLYRQLVLQRGKLDILTPGWPKIGVASATLGIVANTRVPLPPLYASLGRWPRGPACWAAARYFLSTVLLLLSFSCPGGAAAASKRLNFWMRSTTFWAVWVCVVQANSNEEVWGVGVWECG